MFGKSIHDNEGITNTIFYINVTLIFYFFDIQRTVHRDMFL